MLALLLGGQFVLAMVFGVETFFYSAHWGPMLVVISALSALTPARRFAVPLAAALAVVAGVNNIQKFDGAAARLEERYRHERQFTARVAELTSPGSLIVCGRHAAAAQGEPAHSSGRNPGAAPVSDIGLTDDPDTCYFRFDDLQVRRRGWIVSYEDWSIESIEAFRQRGARYFITPYSYGLQHSATLLRAMDARFRRLELTSNWAFYDLLTGSGFDTAGDGVTDQR